MRVCLDHIFSRVWHSQNRALVRQVLPCASLLFALVFYPIENRGSLKQVAAAANSFLFQRCHIWPCAREGFHESVPDRFWARLGMRRSATVARDSFGAYCPVCPEEDLGSIFAWREWRINGQFAGCSC
jgi:hypothetical protein